MSAVTKDGGAVLSLAAGTVFQGQITLSATAYVAPGSPALTVYPSLQISGQGGSFADQEVIATLALFVPAVPASASVGLTASQSVTIGPLQIQSGAAPVSLVMNLGPGVIGATSTAGVTFTS